MLLVDDLMAIQYDIVNVDRATGVEKPGTTMEFARFKDFSDLGAKVDEGFGGSKNESYPGLLYFLTKDERAAQNAFMQSVCDIVLPETDDLEAKYPVVYPTTIGTELGRRMKALILKDFDSWNSGVDAYDSWVDSFYTDDMMYDYRGTKYNSKDELKAGMKDLVESQKRVHINNILISEDWAAIHFYTVTTDAEGKKEADNHMQFLHFVADGDALRVDKCWAK